MNINKKRRRRKQTFIIFCSQPRQTALLDLAYSIQKSCRPPTGAVAAARFFPLPFAGGGSSPQASGSKRDESIL